MRDDSIIAEVWQNGQLIQTQGAQVKKSDGTYMLRSKKGTQEFPGETTFRGDFDRGLRSGQGLVVKENGEFVFGNWVNDKLQGFTVSNSSDSSMLLNIEPEFEDLGDNNQLGDNLGNNPSESK